MYVVPCSYKLVFSHSRIIQNDIYNITTIIQNPVIRCGWRLKEAMEKPNNSHRRVRNYMYRYRVVEINFSCLKKNRIFGFQSFVNIFLKLSLKWSVSSVTCLVAQWLRTCLAMQGTWAQSLVREVRSHPPQGVATTEVRMPQRPRSTARENPPLPATEKARTRQRRPCMPK